MNECISLFLIDLSLHLIQTRQFRAFVPQPLGHIIVQRLFGRYGFGTVFKVLSRHLFQVGIQSNHDLGLRATFNGLDETVEQDANRVTNDDVDVSEDVGLDSARVDGVDSHPGTGQQLVQVDGEQIVGQFAVAVRLKFAVGLFQHPVVLVDCATLVTLAGQDNDSAGCGFLRRI
jgi:hypothetical protein